MDILSLLRNSPGAQAWLAQQAPASALAAVGISPREALDREMSYDGSHPRQQEQAARDHFRSYGPNMLMDALIPGYGAGGDAKAASEAYGEGRYGAAALNAGMAAADFLPFLSVLPAAAKGIRAFHGSPHDFDRFDMSKIGTGEGAQAYGHGLYFAENEAVAREYRDALSGNRTTFRDPPKFKALGGEAKFIGPSTAIEMANSGPWVAERRLATIKKEVAELEAQARAEPDIAPIIDDMIESYRGEEREIAALLKNGFDNDRPLSGRMYEVNINADPEAFLDWDKPLSEQPVVRDRLMRYAFPDTAPTAISAVEARGGASIANPPQSAGNLTARSAADSPEMAGSSPAPASIFDGYMFGAVRTQDGFQPRVDGPDGQRIYRDVTLKTRGEATAAGRQRFLETLAKPKTQQESAFLRDAGIPGIKYLDAGSRGAGDGSRNYVVFDDRLITILRKYGIGGLIAGGGAYALTDAEYAQAAELLAQDGMNTGAQ